MTWFSPDDPTEGVITARKHIASAHHNAQIGTLPSTCIVFEMGGALSYLRDQYNTVVLAEKIPAFLTEPPCIAVEGHASVCFTQGGYGAPAAVDVLETLRALGVACAIIVGMCGIYASHIQVGDIVIPHKILSEEGTSRHYCAEADWAFPDDRLHTLARSFFENKSTHIFPLHTEATVTTDAVYRQTFFKEALWRERGCVGVDMESSAMLMVGHTLGMSVLSILLASDRHPIHPGDANWAWGNEDFRQTKRRFWDAILSFAFLVEAHHRGTQ